MTCLIIAEHDNTVLNPGTLNAIAAATRLGGTVHALVAGRNAAPVAEALALAAPITKVLYADGEALAEGLAEPLAAQIVAVAQDYSHIFFAATARGKSVAPRVAALLGVAQISDAIAILSEDTFERPIYAGNAIATVQSCDPVKVVTIRLTAFDPVSTSGGSAEIHPVTAVAVSHRSRLVSRTETQSGRPDLTAARIVVSGGRGLGSEREFTEILAPLADKLDAAMGASRAAVDAGYAPNDWQVGQTGKIVAPDLYIAVGISGAIQHLAGMSSSKVIVAINKDPEAPIFQVADYGLAADLFATVPELVKAL